MKAKVIKIDDNGKISLSIKQAMSAEEKKEKRKNEKQEKDKREKEKWVMIDAKPWEVSGFQIGCENIFGR